MMRTSILNTAATEQMGYDIVSFFCVLVPEGMNVIVFGERRGEIRRLLLARKVYQPEEKNDILPQYSSEFIVYNDS